MERLSSIKSCRGCSFNNGKKVIKEPSQMKMKELIALLATGTVSIFGGCSLFSQPQGSAVVRDNGRSVVSEKELARKPELKDLHQYAALSASIYVDSEKRSTNSFEDFCRSENVVYQPEGWRREKNIHQVLPVITAWANWNGRKTNAR
jgi:hypothetical protein